MIERNSLEHVTRAVEELEDDIESTGSSCDMREGGSQCQIARVMFCKHMSAIASSRADRMAYLFRGT